MTQQVLVVAQTDEKTITIKGDDEQGYQIHEDYGGGVEFVSLATYPTPDEALENVRHSPNDIRESDCH